MIGASIRRTEDRRLLTGRGKYAADFRLPGMLHAAVLRSPHAHARLGTIYPEAAPRPGGGGAVITARDLAGGGRVPGRLGPRPSPIARLPLPAATDKVLYRGGRAADVI